MNLGPGDAPLCKFCPAIPRGAERRVRVGLQECLGSLTLHRSALASWVHKKGAVVEHQADRKLRDRQRRTTARLTAVQSTPRLNSPDAMARS